MIVRPHPERWGTLSHMGVAALLAFAPLMCVAFCRVVSGAHQAAPASAFHCDPPLSHRPPASPDGSRAPLGDLQQLIRAVTECAPAPWLWLTALSALASLTAFKVSLPLCLGLQPPKPPPRLDASSS
ncbi:MAG: hypothetical protein ACK4JD_01015 [Thermoflexales bacterium]